MKPYKRHLLIGDEAITKRTAYRYRIDQHESSTSDEEVPIEVSENPPEHDDSSMSSSVEEHDMVFSNLCEAANQIQDETINVDEDETFNNYLRNIVLENRSTDINSKSRPKNLQEFMKSEDFFRIVTTPVDKSIGEIVYMILKYSITNGLSVTAMTNLFKLINTLFSEVILPDSRYVIDELLNSKSGLHFHAVCHNCSAYIGKFEEIRTVQSCRVCNVELDLANPSYASYFVLIDPSVQIADLLNIHGNYYNKVVRERQHEPGHIKDIYDCNSYRKLVTSLSEHDKENYVTAIFNTDGAPKYKSSQYSIWPIHMMLNELPPQHRMNNLITCGLWFHRTKPDMSVLLSPFVDLINDLTNKGICCTIEGEQRLIKPYVICCCVDSSARAPIQGIMQYNGHCGCTWCLHAGVYAFGSMRYPKMPNVPALRDDDVTVEEMLNVDLENPIHGIKYPSPFINLESFKIVSGFVPDYLHCCLEGVAKQLTEYYVASLTKDDVQKLDSILKSIAAPDQISRLSRPLSIRNDWKAREWENFVLYYSVPLYSLVLSKKLLNHWMLFVQSLYICLKDDIHIDELNYADEMLHNFVRDCEKHFGLKSMTYNVHQLLHICTSVLNFGPLWTHSTFSFESANHYLLKAIKCARGVPQQITRFVYLNHSTLVLRENIFPTASEIVKVYCDDVLGSKLKNVHKLTGISYFGVGSSLPENILRQFSIPADSEYFDKMVLNNCLFESSTKLKRRANNSFAQLKDKRYVRFIRSVRAFIVHTESKIEMTLCQLVLVNSSFDGRYSELKIIESIEEEYILVPTINIDNICVFMNIDQKKYVCAVPNVLHY